jgi:hypothetical protein
MKFISFLIICFVTTLISSGQDLNLETGLDSAVSETSGLLFLNNTLITHNDSDAINQLFDVDMTTGAVTRTVAITNATNIDWEDLTHDDTYIYIGDIGNYQGDRTNLKIYRIAIADYFSSTTVTAELINFSYSNQTDFTANPLSTNFDAESLIHYDNSLYIFSKNWLDGKTNIYQLSKTPGTYTISMIDTIDSQGLISGATYNTLDNTITLCGYDLNGAFLIQLSAFNSGLFSNGNINKTIVSVPENYSPQIEGIAPINATEYYVTAEENSPFTAGLYSFNSATLSVDLSKEDSILFYPNPAEYHITLTTENAKTQIYTISGKLVKTAYNKEIDISNLSAGIYIMKIKKSKSGHISIKRLVIKD